MADDISAAQPTRPTAVVPTLSTRRLSWTSTESPAKPFVNRSQPNSWSMTWCSTQKPILRSSAKTRQVLRRPFVVHAYYYYYTILSQEPKQLNCRNLIVVERRLHYNISKTMAALSLSFIILITPWTFKEVIEACTGTKVLSFCLTFIYSQTRINCSRPISSLPGLQGLKIFADAIIKILMPTKSISDKNCYDQLFI